MATPMARKKAAGTLGSAVRGIHAGNDAVEFGRDIVDVATGKKKKNPAHELTAAQMIRLTEESLSSKGHKTNDPSPIYKPYVTPGVPGKPGTTLYVGNLTPDKVMQRHNNNRFTFHWNPEKVSVDASANYNAANAPTPQYQDGARNLLITATSVSLQVMIERQDEVAIATMDPADSRGHLAHPIYLQYGSNSFQGVKAKTFADVGTLYDLEFLYLAINGPQRQSALGPVTAPAVAAPFITPNTMYLSFGKSIQYFGYITNLHVDHEMFTPKMVPILSYVTITMVTMSMNSPYQDFSNTVSTKVGDVAKATNL